MTTLTSPLRAASGSPAGAPVRTRRVTDAPTRTFHALFALSFLGAYASGDSEAWRALHVTLGYAMAGLLAWRLVYGFVGPRPVRWTTMARRVTGLPDWLRRVPQLLRGEAIGPWWRQGESLALGLALLVLLAGAVPLAASGWVSWQEWTGDWMGEIHEALAEALFAVALIHIGLIAWLGLRRRRNTALPMWNGQAPGPGPDLVPSQRRWLAVLMLAAVVGFGAMQWADAPDGLVPPPSAWFQGDHGHDDDD